MNKNNKYKVFLVDDNEFFLDSLEQHLLKTTKYSIEIFKFSNGSDCIKNLSLLPDVIVLDYFFDTENISENANGVEILKEIKQIKTDLKVIMLSHQDKIDVATLTIKYGAFDYVVKNSQSFIKIQILLEVIFKSLIQTKKLKRYKYGLIGLFVFIVFQIIIFLIFLLK